MKMFLKKRILTRKAQIYTRVTCRLWLKTSLASLTKVTSLEMRLCVAVRQQHGHREDDRHRPGQARSPSDPGLSQQTARRGGAGGCAEGGSCTGLGLLLLPDGCWPRTKTAEVLPPATGSAVEALVPLLCLVSHRRAAATRWSSCSWIWGV